MYFPHWQNKLCSGSLRETVVGKYRFGGTQVPALQLIGEPNKFSQNRLTDRSRIENRCDIWDLGGYSKPWNFSGDTIHCHFDSNGIREHG